MGTTTTEQDNQTTTRDQQRGSAVYVRVEGIVNAAGSPVRMEDQQLMRGRISADGWTVSLVLEGWGVVEYGLLECHPSREVLVLVDPFAPGEIAVWLPLVGPLQKWIGHGHALGRVDLTGAELLSVGAVGEPWLPVVPDVALPSETWLYVRDTTGRVDLVWDEASKLAAQILRRADMGEIVEWEVAEAAAHLGAE